MRNSLVRVIPFGLVLGALPAIAHAQQQGGGGVVTVGEPSNEAPVEAGGVFGAVRLQGGRVVLGATSASPRLFDPGCAARAVIATGTQLHVACESVVRTFAPGATPDATPSLVAERRVGAEVRGLFLQGGRVWVEYARVEAQPVENLAPATTGGLVATGGPVGRMRGAAEPGGELAPEQARGSVIEIHGTQVVVSIGRNQGLRGNEHVEIGGRRGGEEPGEIQPTIVGSVHEVAASRATVDVGFDEPVSIGDRVRLTTRPTTGSMLAPPRTGQVIEIGGTVRVAIPIGSLGVGAIADLTGTWRAAVPFALRVRLFPMGLMYSNGSSYSRGDQTGGTFGAALDAMFDSQFFAIRLGIGAAQSSSYSGGPQFGFAISQVLRVGAIDGFNLTGQNHLTVSNSRFEYGGTDASIQIPLTRTWWLLLRGGGQASFGYGEIGMRIAVSGSGRGGTLFVTPTLGVAGMTVTSSGYYGGSTSAIGPTAGIGLDYRFGI